VVRPIASRVREHFDWALFAAVAAVAVIGVINLYSATFTHPSALLRDLYIKQIYLLAFGTLGALLVAAIDYRHFERLAYVLYAVGVGLLGLTLLVAETTRGSRRWLDFGPLGFQPSEVMKLLLVVALAKYLHDHPKQEGRNFQDLAIPGAMAALPIALVLRQPDLGTALLLFLAFLTIMLLTRLKLRSFLTLAVIGILTIPITWEYLLEDYQKERILSFKNAWMEQESAEGIQNEGYHARQSIIAVGSGRVLGKGFLQGTQNIHRFLPDQHTDFPFAVWAEEQGFLGAAVVLGLYLFVVLWSLRIAAQAKDRFGAVVAVGVGSIFFWHTVLNLGMVMGLLPVVGVTLPLFSSGGSSVLTVLLGIGLLMNVSIRRFHF
jgi:rod shape determining protein RodA